MCIRDSGYNATDKNGVYGKETKWAVRLFQQDRGLPVDGIVGPATYNLSLIHI